MQVKKIVSLFVGLPVLAAGVAVSFTNTPDRQEAIPVKDSCPVKCCLEKKSCNPAKSETTYPETRSIFLPEDFFTGV